MKPSCALSGHRWDGCTCAVCGQIRDFGHDWADTGKKVYVVTTYESGNQYGEDFPDRVCTRCGMHYDWEKAFWGEP